MAKLRLFAGLREAAGTTQAELPGDSVAEILDEASRRFGPEFAAGLDRAGVWVNGEPAEPDTGISSDDEVALLPPVSGGAETVAASSAVSQGLASLVLLVLLGVANIASAEWFVTALVGVLGYWVWDVFDQADERSSGMVRWPALIAALAGPVTAYRWSSAGFGLAIGFVVIGVFVWAIARPQLRDIERLAGTMVTAILVAAAGGALALVRLGGEGEDRITSFLIIAGVAAAVTWFLLRPEGGVLDPYTGAALAAVAAGFVLGLVYDTSLAAMVLAGAAVALGFLAGRSYGSLLRTGQLMLMQPLPGSAVPLDGAVMAAPLFWITLALVA